MHILPQVWYELPMIEPAHDPPVIIVDTPPSYAPSEHEHDGYAHREHEHDGYVRHEHMASLESRIAALESRASDPVEVIVPEAEEEVEESSTPPEEVEEIDATIPKPRKEEPKKKRRAF